MEFVRNNTNDLIVSNDANELLVNTVVIASQRDKNEYMEAGAEWTQEYSSVLWKVLIEGSIKADYCGKMDFDLIDKEIAIFLETFKK